MKANRKVRDLSLQRGLAAENRLISILRSLRSDTPWIGKICKAGIKHDRTGVDIFISIKPQSGICHLKVPVQVKSSKAGLVSHYAKYGEGIDVGCLVVIVNNNYSDEDLSNFLKEKLEILRR